METEKNTLQNYNAGFESVKKEYELALTRFKEMDGKFNTLLVFIAGEIAAFGAIFSIFNNYVNLRIIFAVTFFAFLLVAIITNFIGLFTKKIYLLNTALMVDQLLYEVDNITFYAKLIGSYHNYTASIEEKIRMKSTLFNVSLIFVLLSMITFCTFIVIRLFFV